MKVSLSISLRTLWAASMLLTTLSLGGCRHPQEMAQRDAFIQELRTLEDQNYLLQDRLEECQRQLHEKQLHNASLLQPAGDAASDDRSSSENDTEERSLFDPNDFDSNNFDPDDDEQSEPQLPEIDLGDPGMPEIELGEPLPSPSSRQTTSAEPEVASSAEPPSMPAKSVAIYAEPMPLEAIPGREEQDLGLLVIVQPLTADGAAGEFTGQLSLRIVDPLAEENSDSQPSAAKWDYTAEEVEQAWRDPSRRVLDLPLAVPPALVPVGRPLELWVRLMPAAGEEIRSHTMFELASAVQLLGAATDVAGQRTNLVVTDWSTADPRDPPARTRPTSPARQATWQPATEMPPAAIVRAAATTRPFKRPTWHPDRHSPAAARAERDLRR